VVNSGSPRACLTAPLSFVPEHTRARAPEERSQQSSSQARPAASSLVGKTRRFVWVVLISINQEGKSRDVTVSDHTRKRHVEAILALFRYRLCALDERLLLEAHARQIARISSRPVYVLRDRVDPLRREGVVLPGYAILQNLVRAALIFERKRLISIRFESAGCRRAPGVHEDERLRVGCL